MLHGTLPQTQEFDVARVGSQGNNHRRTHYVQEDSGERSGIDPLFRRNCVHQRLHGARATPIPHGGRSHLGVCIPREGQDCGAREIVNKASISMMQEGKPRELQAGSNGFTCLISPDGTPLCADQNALEWMKAVRERTNPPDRIGFIYMLAGDTGTTNHHPHQRETRLHWVQTGPHVMVIGPRVREMVGYSRTLDVADPNQPYSMFPGLSYEHLMLPTQ